VYLSNHKHRQVIPNMVITLYGNKLFVVSMFFGSKILKYKKWMKNKWIGWIVLWDVLSREWKSQHRSQWIWRPPKTLNIPFWLTLYLFYSYDLFEILRCPFPQWSFPTHAISKFLQHSVFHSVNLLLSISCSLRLLPIPFSPVAIWYKYSNNFVSGIIE